MLKFLPFKRFFTRQYSAVSLEEPLTHINYRSIPSGLVNTEVTVLKNGLTVATYYAKRPISKIGLFVGDAGVSSDPALATLLRGVFFTENKKTTTFVNRRSMDLIGANFNLRSAKEFFAVSAFAERPFVSKCVELIANALSNKFYRWEMEDALEDLLTENEFAKADTSLYLLDCLHSVSFRSGLSNSLVPQAYKLKSVSCDCLERYARDRYTGANCVLVGVDVEHQFLVDLVQKSFLSQIKKGIKLNPSKDLFKGGRDLRLESRGTRSTVLLGFAGGQLGEKEALAYALLRLALCAGPSTSWGQDKSRLMNTINGIKLIEEGKLTSISASCLSYLHSGLFFIEIVGEGKYMKKIMTTVAQALKEVREKGLTASEVARAQKLLKREALNCFSANLLLDDIGQQLLFKGKYNPVHEILKRIDSISLQDVSAAAKKLANPSMVAYGVVDTVPYLDQLEL